MSSGSALVASGTLPQAPSPRVIVISPNCSLTPRTAALFLLATGGVTLLIASLFAARGLWPILPFAGAEVALLVWATCHSIRRGAERETLEITHSAVTVEVVTGASRETTVFPRHWTGVKLRAPHHGPHPSRLCLEAQGRSHEVGRWLTEDERQALAVRLKQLIGNVNESPVLRQ